MRRFICLCAALCAAAPSVSWAFQEGPAYRQLQAAAKKGGPAFDEPINPAIFAAPGSPAAGRAQPQLVRGLEPRSGQGDFVIGKPRDYGEPKNPLLRGQDKPKENGSSWGWKILGGFVGGLLGGVVGFFLGGPVGAAIGFAAGAAGGWMVTR